MATDFSFSCLVAGELRGRSWREAINPARGEPVARFAVADEAMLEDAVRSAEGAYEAWRTSPLRDRAVLLRELADVVSARAEDLARLLTLEQGKPLAEARGEVGFVELILRSHADLANGAGHSLFEEEGEHHLRTYTPLGVAAGIVPWNFPLLIAAMKIAPALLTGNAIIIKPAPTTPLTTLALGGLVKDIAPPGLLQVLGDDGALGPQLTAHPGIAKIAFTGSTATGRAVMAAASGTLKRHTLELGGNDPAIVLDDVDVDSCAERIFAAAFTNAGQVCGAVKRVYVQDGVFEAFSAALSGRVAAAVVGDGLDERTTLGPVQNRRQFARASALLEEARLAGRIMAQAEVPDGPGYFVPPTLVADLPETHTLVAEEQFAPLLPVQRFTAVEDAIRAANGTPYGLTASVWSSDRARAEAAARQVDAALVCVNRHNEDPVGLGVAMAKQSGIGWLLGEEGIKEYLQPHLVIR